MPDAKKILLRIQKRRSSVKAANLEEFCELELRNRKGEPDLNLSVYLVDDEPSVIAQTYAEHAAHVGLDSPIGGFSNFVVSDIVVPRMVHKPTQRQFPFTGNSHYELQFDNEGQLKQFAKTLFENLTPRLRRIEVPQVRTFLSAKLADGDQDWIAYVSTRPDWQKWIARKSK